MGGGRLLGGESASISRSLEIVSEVVPIPTTSNRILKRVTFPLMDADGAGGARIDCESWAVPKVLSMVLVPVKELPSNQGRPPWSNSNANRILGFQDRVTSKPLIFEGPPCTYTISAVNPPPLKVQQELPLVNCGLSETNGKSCVPNRNWSGEPAQEQLESSVGMPAFPDANEPSGPKYPVAFCIASLLPYPQSIPRSPPAEISCATAGAVESPNVPLTS